LRGEDVCYIDGREHVTGTTQGKGASERPGIRLSVVLVDEAALTRAFGRIRKDAAVGVDGITWEQYGQELERNVRDLYQRLRTMRWRHQPIRRVHSGPLATNHPRPCGTSGRRSPSLPT